MLPADQPRYPLLIMLDEPQAMPETHGFATSGWNAVPVGGAVIARIAPLLGIEPRFDLAPADKLILASAGRKAAQTEPFPLGSERRVFVLAVSPDTPRIGCNAMKLKTCSPSMPSPMRASPRSR